ncbi:MAG TPA: nucleotidyltransferase family protein [Gemmatimonadaceae bacterium]
MRTRGSAARTRSLLHYLLDEAASPPASTEGWRMLAAEAEAQELDATAFGVLSARGDEPPAEVLQRLALATALNGVRNAQRRAELRAILDAFAAAGIDSIVLKGMHLAHRVYPDPSMRVMADMDLLVRKASLPVAARVMRELGYRADREEALEHTIATAHHLPAFRREDASPVEIHWTISRPPAPFDVGIDGLWERSRSARLGDVEAHVLSDEDLLRHLCVHLSYNHSWVLREQREVPLRAIVDIAMHLRQSAPSLDCAALAERANRDGSGRFIYCALAVVERLAGVPLAHLLPLLDRRAGDDAIVAMACELVSARETGGVAESVTHVASLRGASRARAAWRAVFPTREMMRGRFGLATASEVRPAHYLRRLAGFIVEGRWLGAFTARGRTNAEQRRRRAIIKAWKRTAARRG